MLRMSKLADYAFIILTQMMLSPEKSWPASSLAEATSLPLPTVAKLMKLLAKTEIVSASRGAAGGYRLARAPDTLSIAEIIEAVEGPIRLTECAGKATGKASSCDCAVGGGCPVKKNWGRVNSAIKGALEEIKLSEFVGISL